MRKIKFRGRWNGRWVYGGIEIRHNGEILIGGNGIWSVVDSKTVGQFTNLKDKNGKEIYEGDILRHKPHWSDDSTISVAGMVSPFHCGDWSVYAGDCEVIGNVHENHDLCPTS